MSFYEYGIRYMSNEDETGIETYDKKTGETISSNIKRHFGQIYFTINDLTFRENFELPSESEDKESQRFSQKEFCQTKARFGYFPTGNEWDKYSMTFIGTDKELKEIDITIRATDKDEKIGATFYSLEVSVGLDVTISTSYFNRIKELVFSGRMDVLILGIESSSLDGLYSPWDYFGPFDGDRIMILDSIERVENSEEMPEMFTDTMGDNSSSEKSFGFNRKPSKKFNLMYHTKNFKFKPEDNE